MTFAGGLQHRAILFAAFVAGLAAPSAAGAGFDRLGFGLERQLYNPLLPDIYERSGVRFTGLSISMRALPSLDLRLGAARSDPYFDGPYNDVSNYSSKTHILKLEAEWGAFRAGPLRFLVAAGGDYLATSWKADDLVWEDPPEPREFWFGGLTRWAVHAAPGIELFREEQSVDWTVALSLPMYLAFGTDFDGMGESAQGRFRDAYLEDSGLAVALTIGLGFGLGR